MDGIPRRTHPESHGGATSTVRFILWWYKYCLRWASGGFRHLAVLPKPQEVARAFAKLWLEQGLSRELLTSFMLNLEALAISTVIALGLSYLTVLPVFRPIAAAAFPRGAFSAWWD